MISAKDQPWVILFETTISKTTDLIELGANYIDQLTEKTDNYFWINVLHSWKEFNVMNKQKILNEALSQPLWLNPSISENNLFLKNWYQKGIKVIADLFDEKGVRYNINQLIEKYDINNIDYLTLHRIKTLTISYLKRITLANHPDPTDYEFNRPYIPFHASKLIKDKTGIKTIYNTLNSDNISVSTVTKWENDLNIVIEIVTWERAYKTCFGIIKDNYLIWLQYKMSTRILGTKDLLVKMKLSNSAACNFCNTETLLHLFCQCNIIKKFWINITQWTNRKLNINIILDDMTIILGYLTFNKMYYAINTIILLAKSYIFFCSRKKINPNIIQFLNRLEKSILEQKAIATKNSNLLTYHQRLGQLEFVS